MVPVGETKIFLFGGEDDPAEHTKKADLWMFHLKTKSWSEVQPRGKRPCARSEHALLYVPPNNLVLWGGLKTNNEPLPNHHIIYILDLQCNYWTCPYIGHLNQSPKPALGMAVSNFSSGCMICFGGLPLGVLDAEGHADAGGVYVLHLDEDTQIFHGRKPNKDSPFE